MKYFYILLKCTSVLLIAVSQGIVKDLNGQNTINIRSGYSESWLYDMGPRDEYRYGDPEFGSKPAFYAGFSFYRPKKKHIHLEYSINLTSKFVSLYTTYGGLGSSVTTDADYKLFFSDISVYPAVVFGNKIKIIGSIRPIISIMFASLSSGEKSWWIIGTEYGVTPTTGSKTISGWANEFKFLSFDLAFNTRIEYKLNEKLGVLLECQYSKGINNISNNGDFEYNFQNLIIGTGIRVQLHNNNCSAFD